MRRIVDEEGVELPTRAGDRDSSRKFLCAREGDNLITPFLCELCHFRNIQKRDPRPHDPKDQRLLTFARRANLDAFFSREASTVRNNCRELRALERYGALFGMRSACPPMGPFPLEDSLGMTAALMVLERSQQRTGRYEEYVQPETYRKAQAALTNVARAGVEGLGERIGAYERTKVWMSSSATHTNWFSRFMTGLKRRTGQVIRQDKAISIQVLKAVMTHLEDRWATSQSREERLELSRSGAWFSIGFCIGLRGEEMLQIERAATLHSLNHLTPTGELPGYFCVTINGSTKGNRLAGSTIAIPCAALTSKSQIPAGAWVSRLASGLEEADETPGFLFGLPSNPTPRLVDYEDYFFQPLEAVQEVRPDLIDPSVDIRDDYGIWRSLRRGVTAHAINVEVPVKLIELVNRWRSELSERSTGGSMINVYTEYEALLPTTIKYSHRL